MELIAECEIIDEKERGKECTTRQQNGPFYRQKETKQTANLNTMPSEDVFFLLLVKVVKNQRRRKIFSNGAATQQQYKM